MNIDTAKEVISILANGIDPITGEVFPDDSPLNNPNIIRALFSIIEENGKENLTPKNAGSPWTNKLKEDLATLYKQGKSVKELSQYFGRTYGAIRSELKHQELS